MRKLRILLVTIALASITLIAAPSTAQAAEKLHVRGTACPGGYITALFYYTQYETTNAPSYIGNNFDIHLLQFERFGNTQIHFSVKCNNNQWYYPVRSIPFWAINPYDVGAI